MTPARARMLPVVVIAALLVGAVAAGSASAATPIKRLPAAERYAHSLLNCTRTGGLVTATGSCLKRGSGAYSAYRKPLRLHQGIGTKVAWPWARTMIAEGFCGHDYPGRPSLAQRMRSSSFRYHAYGENLGCGSGYGKAKAIVLAVHRMMQAEQQSNGGHWRNIKALGYKSVGIGVATRFGHTTVVWDFYGKRY